MPQPAIQPASPVHSFLLPIVQRLLFDGRSTTGVAMAARPLRPRQVAPLFLLCCTALLLSLLPSVFALRYGDPVSMLKRVQHNQLRSPSWVEVMGPEAPKFGVSKSVRLAPLSELVSGSGGSNAYSAESATKLSLSFADEKFPVNWVTLADGKGHFLQRLDITFTHAQGNIRALRWKASYYPDKMAVGSGAGGRDDVEAVQQHINYHWQEQLENDPAAAVNVVLLVGAVGVAAAAGLILMGWDRPNSNSSSGSDSMAAAIPTNMRSTRVPNNSSSTRSAPAPAYSRSNNVPHGSHGSSWHAEDVHDA